MNKEFTNIVLLIQQSRSRAYHAVNAELVNLYWQVGQYVSRQLSVAAWGDKTVEELVDYIQKTEPQTKGFNKRAVYRMRQFFETYKDSAIPGMPSAQLNKDSSAIGVPVEPQLDKKAIGVPVEP